MSWPRGSNISPVRIQSYSAEEMLAALDHRRALELRDRAAGDQPDRVAAGMAVDAEEGVARHFREPFTLFVAESIRGDLD